MKKAPQEKIRLTPDQGDILTKIGRLTENKVNIDCVWFGVRHYASSLTNPVLEARLADCPYHYRHYDGNPGVREGTTVSALARKGLVVWNAKRKTATLTPEGYDLFIRRAAASQADAWPEGFDVLT